MLSLQLESGSKDDLQNIGQSYGETNGCRSWIAYSLRDGLLSFPEPGNVPRGLILFEMDEKPACGQEKGVVRRDVWDLAMEKGDVSLSL